MQRSFLLAVAVLLLGAAFAAAAGAQTPGATVTPSEGYGSACPASGTELADHDWCDLKVAYPDAVIEAQPVDYRGDRDEIDPSLITIEGVTGGTATAIACESHSPPTGFSRAATGSPT